MKHVYALPLLVLGLLSGPVLADTAAAPGESCQFVDPPLDASDTCKAERVKYRAEVNACIAQMQADAVALNGTATSNTSHSYRARFLICDAAIQAKMSQLSN